MPDARLRTLGAFELSIDGASVGRPSTQKARALLAFLALNKHQEISRERLMELFWPAADAENARQSLKTALWSLRRVLRSAGQDVDEFLRASNATVEWTHPTVVDVEQLFEANIETGSAILDGELLAGVFLDGDYDEWTVLERERIERQRERLLNLFVERTGDPQAAEALLARDPYSAAAYETLIACALASGQRSGASSLAQRYASALEELGAPIPEHVRELKEFVPRSRATFDLPFVGRQNTLSALHARVNSGEGTITFLVGAAGMGKTRILRPLAQMLADRRCLQFAPKNELSVFAGWDVFFEGVTEQRFAAVRDRFEQRLPAAFASAVDSALPSGTVLLIDDAHRLESDALTIAATLTSVLTASGKHVVFSTRPEGLPVLRRALAHTQFFEHHIEHLSEDEVAHAIGRAAGRALPECALTLYRKSGGYPIFMRCIVEEWLTSAALHFEGSSWRFDGKRAEDDLPTSVRSLIDARLRERGDETATIASALALEPAATHGVLAACTQLTEGQVLDALDNLFELGLVVEREDGRLAFAHDLVQETASRALHGPRRRTMHQRLANELVKDATQFSVRIAFHYGQAGLLLEAADWYVQATLDAMRVFAYSSAIAAADAGITALEDTQNAPAGSLRAKLLLWKGVSMVNAGDAVTGRQVGRLAIEEAEKAHDDRTRLEAIVRLARSGAQVHEERESDLIAEGERLAAKLEDRTMFAALQYARFIPPFNSGDMEKAVFYLELEFEAAQQANDSDLKFEALCHLQKAYSNNGYLERAMAILQELLPLAVSPLQLADYHYSAAHTHLLLFRYEEAFDHACRGQAALAKARRDALRFQPRRLLLDFGLLEARRIALAGLRRYDDAIVRLDEELLHPLLLGTPSYQALANIEAVELLSWRGLPEDLERAGSLLRSIPLEGCTGSREASLIGAETLLRARCHDPTLASELSDRLRKLNTLVDRFPQNIASFPAFIEAARQVGDAKVLAAAEEKYAAHLDVLRDNAGPYWNGPAIAQPAAPAYP